MYSKYFSTWWLKTTYYCLSQFGGLIGLSWVVLAFASYIPVVAVRGWLLQRWHARLGVQNGLHMASYWCRLLDGSSAARPPLHGLSRWLGLLTARGWVLSGSSPRVSIPGLIKGYLQNCPCYLCFILLAKVVTGLAQDKGDGVINPVLAWGSGKIILQKRSWGIWGLELVIFVEYNL